MYILVIVHTSMGLFFSNERIAQMNFGVYAGSGNRRRWPAPATSTSHWHRILALPALGSVSRSAVVLTNEKK